MMEPLAGRVQPDHIVSQAEPTLGWWLRTIIYAVCVTAFAADLTHNDSLAFGVFYMPLVGTAIYHSDPRAVWYLACLASAMVLVGYFSPEINPDYVTAVINRGLSLAAIWITAQLIWQERQIREQLISQTRRATAAVRMKARIFTNLSHELRTPLAAILGFADLLLADARPDQRTPLGHIQGGGKRLLGTVDNLLDLTQLDERTLRPRSLNLPALLRKAIEASQMAAAERGITLSVQIPDKVLLVVTDGWALRRILDNIIANGIKFTEPGGSVEVSARIVPGGVAVLIRDTGPGMPPKVLHQIGEPFFQADSGAARRFEGMGTGLALCLRLAAIMGAQLNFDSAPAHGTTVILTLPSADV